MQMLFELLPIVFFFAAYKLAGIYVATAVLIVGVLVQTAVSWFRHRKVSPLLLCTAALVLVFGGLTLALHDPTFIKWKPTVVDLLFAGVFLASQWMKGPTITERLMGAQIKLEPAHLWNRLNMVWVAFFVLCAGLNLYVAYNFSEATWVNFKLFGLTGLMFLLVLAQGLWIARKMDGMEAAAESTNADTAGVE
jgi:intracellular septation protein